MWEPTKQPKRLKCQHRKCVYFPQEISKVNLTQDPYNDKTSDKDFDKQWPIIEKQQHYNKRP